MPLFFNHITKTAGTTVQGILEFCAPRERILASTLREEISGSGFHLLPPSDLADYDIVMGHLGEQVRRAYFGEHLSLTVLREPVSRFKSLIRHDLRDASMIGPLSPLTGKIPEALADMQSREIIMAVSQLSFLCPYWMYGGAFEDWTGSIDTAVQALNAYDVVLTESGLQRGLSLILALFGQRPLEQLPHLNAAEEHPAPEVSFPDDLREKLERLCPEDFELYAAARKREEDLFLELDSNPLELLFGLRGRLSRKDHAYHLDWLNPPPCFAWSTVVWPHIDGLEELPSRMMLGEKAALFLPLTRNGTRKAHLLVWASQPEIISGKQLRLSIDGTPAAWTTFLPLLPDMHLARLVFEIPASSQRGWTTVEFHLPNKSPSEQFWLIDFSAENTN